jgi:oxygen-independent coproporphyrinogen-3 oxidase
MSNLSLYLHIPFCQRRCGYCDFNTFAGLSRWIPAYVDALCQEAKEKAIEVPPEDAVHTIFFGGGTPSLLSPGQVDRILSTIRSSFHVLEDEEITLEANPGTVTAESIQGYVEAGVNRFSFGMQSAHPTDLALLDRRHTYADVVEAIRYCRRYGVQHINLDLIFGIPGQPLERWKRSLELAAASGVDHLSLYALTIEEGTPMARWAERGSIEMPDDDLAAEMYELAEDLLPQFGFEQYEISNWSKGTQARCRHNLQYWQYEPYLALGAGAHGFFKGVRTENVHSIVEYLERIAGNGGCPPLCNRAALEINPLSRWDQMQESMMVGLRLTPDGVSTRRFRSKFGGDFEELFSDQLQRLEHEGLIEWVAEPERKVRLTRRGRRLGNQVFLEFVGNETPPGV